MSSIWQTIIKQPYLTSLDTASFRVIEDQNRSSTRKLVDSIEEHDILESILEKSKPSIYIDENSFKNLHYLLFTPFRYPPLKYGSRFGKKTERGIFYSSLEIATALSEKAYYRFHFLISSAAPLGDQKILFTSFKIKISTKKGIDLCNKNFHVFRDSISSPTSYESSQPLGLSMRTGGVAAFTYYSARSRNNGINIGVFNPTAFLVDNNIKNSFEEIECYFTKKIIVYSRKNKSDRYTFQIEDFFQSGEFPIIKSH